MGKERSRLYRCRPESDAPAPPAEISRLDDRHLRKTIFDIITCLVRITDILLVPRLVSLIVNGPTPTAILLPT